MIHPSKFWPSLAQVCEVFDVKSAGLDERLHLRWNSHETFAICMRQVSNGTMIPLSQWGAADRSWCPACERRIKRPQPLIAQRREEAAI